MSLRETRIRTSLFPKNFLTRLEPECQSLPCICSDGKKVLETSLFICDVHAFMALKISLKSSSDVCFIAATDIYPHAACALFNVACGKKYNNYMWPS